MSDAIILKIIELVATVATLVIGGLISIKLGKLNAHINSRMDQLILETRSSARAEGKVEGKAEGKVEEKEKQSEVVTSVTPVGEAKLKIIGGEVKIESKKK